MSFGCFGIPFLACLNHMLKLLAVPRATNDSLTRILIDENELQRQRSELLLSLVDSTNEWTHSSGLEA